jgi:hypothetical protein
MACHYFEPTMLTCFINQGYSYIILRTAFLMSYGPRQLLKVEAGIVLHHLSVSGNAHIFTQKKDAFLLQFKNANNLSQKQSTLPYE